MDDKWKIIFKQHARAPIYSVGHYVAYLRRFVSDTDPAVAASDSSNARTCSDQNAPAEDQRLRPDDGINPLSYFLRKLMLDLKVSYDSFVSDFVRPPSDGLRLLLRLLGNIQNVGSSGRSRFSSGRSTSKLEAYKRVMTDERDCLLCVKFTLRVQGAVTQLVTDAESLQRIAAGVTGANSKARITCLEILTLILMESYAAENVVEAFTIMRLRSGESVRFKMLVSMLHTKGPSQVLFQASCMKMFNTLLSACPTANMRVYLQQEILSAGLDLQLLSEHSRGDGLEFDDLKREIREWSLRYIDVDELVRRLKSDYRDVLGEFFSGPEGPLQVSSRRESRRGFPKLPFLARADDNVGFAASAYAQNYGSNTTDSFGKGGTSHERQQRVLPHDAAERDGLGHNDIDNSESAIVSVSAQQPPSMHRNHPSHLPLFSRHPRVAGRQRNPSSRGLQDVPTVPGHAPSQALSRPHPGKGFKEEFPEAESSTETIVDAYGLVIHGRKDGDDWAREQSGDLYSNWKLGYFSAPYVSTAETAEEERVQFTAGDDDAAKANADGYDSGVYLPCDDKQTQSKNGNLINRDTWDMPFHFLNKQCYSGPDRIGRTDKSGAGSKRDASRSSSWFLGVHEIPDKAEASSLTTPAPDYTPPVSPTGSYHSLSTEVARVLQEFERTLHAHDHPRPSAVAIETIAYI